MGGGLQLMIRIAEICCIMFKLWLSLYGRTIKIVFYTLFPFFSYISFIALKIFCHTLTERKGISAILDYFYFVSAGFG